MLIVSPVSFTAWDTIALLVSEHVSECPVFLLTDHIKRAARRFFQRSGVWRSPEALLVTTVAGQQTYVHAPPTNGELSRAFSAWTGTTEIDVGDPGEWANEPTVTTSTDFKLEARADNVLWLSPKPASSATLIRGTLVYIPTTAGAGIPSHAFDEWGPEIAAGAAATLVIQPNRQWSNPSAYGALMGIFNSAVSDASNQAGPVRRKSIRVKPW